MGRMMQRTTRQTVAGSLVLLASLCVVYALMLHAGYIWDDDSYLTDNSLIRSLSGLWTLWTVPGAHPQYYPMVFTSYFLEFKLRGLDATGYHITNILLHGLSCLLLWRLLSQFKLRGAWIAVMVFAMHPVMVESVAWITERKNVLSLVFYLCGMLAGVKLLDLGGDAKPLKNKAQTAAWWLVLLLCYVLALLSKTVTVSLPAALLVLVWWKHGRIGKREILLMLPLLVIGLVLGLHTAHLERVTVGAVGQDWDATLLQRTLLAGQIVWFYALKLVYPQPLIFIYHRWQVDPSQPLQWLPVVSLVILLVGLLIASRKHARGPLAAMLLFIGTLFPALGFFNVYPMRFSYVADHFQYHASIALIVLIVCGIASLLHKHSLQKLGAIAAVLALVGMGRITFERCAAYQDARTLWLDTLTQNPSADIAIFNLGSEALNDKRPADALALFNMAVIAHPHRPLPYINRSAAYDALHMQDKRIADMRLAIGCFKDYEPERAMPHMVLGNLAMQQKDWSEAAGQFNQYIRCLPQSSKGYVMLGKAALRMGQDRKAAEVLEKAIALGDEQAGTWYNLALAYQQLGQQSEAVACYQRSLDIAPKNPDALTNLAALYAEAGQFAKAVALQQQAISLHQSKTFLKNMVKMRLGYAMQLAQQGQKSAAVVQLRKVLSESETLGDTALKQKVQKLIATLEK